MQSRGSRYQNICTCSRCNTGSLQASHHKTNDADVIIIAVSILPSLQQLGLQSMWIDFGQGASARWIPVHELLSAIGPEKTSGILYFHAFTGYDFMSAFHRKGKKSACLTWDVCEVVSETFTRLSHCPTGLNDADLQKLETFVVFMYERPSASSGVDKSRLELMIQFHQFRAALKEHAKRAAYQAGIIWGQTIVSNPETSNRANWGWTQTGETLQITLPPITTSCRELTKCSGKKGCNQDLAVNAPQVIPQKKKGCNRRCL